MLPERLIVIADVLPRSVVLAHDEREVLKKCSRSSSHLRKSWQIMERTRRDRKGVLQLIGNALWSSKEYPAASRSEKKRMRYGIVPT